MVKVHREVVTKPDGSVTTTVYDNLQRVVSTVEKTAGGVVITGFEYTYGDLSRIIEEKALENSTKICYTYDELSRVTSRTVKKLSDNVGIVGIAVVGSIIVLPIP